MVGGSDWDWGGVDVSRAVAGTCTLRERADRTGGDTGGEKLGERCLLVREEEEEGWVAVLTAVPRALCSSRPGALVLGVGLASAGVRGRAEGQSPWGQEKS